MNRFAKQLTLLAIAEIAIYLSVLLAIGFRGWLIIPLIVILIVNARLMIVLSTFAIAWFKRAQRPPDMRINWIQTLQLIGLELWAMLVLFSGLHLLEPWLGTRAPSTKQSGIPILFIHGFFSNGAYWWAMHRYLRKQHVTHLFTLNLSAIFTDIDTFAEEVQQRVELICATTGSPKVILVGHSMGGLIARAYFYRHGGRERVAKIITLGSPHQGTFLAYLMGGTNVRQMRLRNPWLSQLNALPSPPIPITSIYSYHDDFIVPQEGSILAGSKNLAVAGVGHLAMSFSKKFQKLVTQEILEMGDTLTNNEDKLS
ncbi:MAG: hypothetical protein BWK79_03540 [Beggiatoa sp. IS2]|nr:MAG: hypothetical protein BWK79_03540 [Beggiatoa sp. IS2]